MPIDEARRNDEVIALADGQTLRWIDELLGIENADAKVRDIKNQISEIRRQPNSLQNKRQIKKLYTQLDELQFKPDYLCLIMDRKSDYRRACRGFTINGVGYKRLLGTNGGIKNSTIVFVSERVWSELRRRIDNDRDMSKSLVTAKLEAYKALVCSASTPVSWPRGIAVVPDAITEFKSDVIFLTDEGVDEPLMEHRNDEVITLDASDGCGIMLPSLADRWSKELGLDYMVSGLNTRCSFEKGMVFTFDFLDFAENIAGSYIIKDVWGNDVDLREVELILTESMLKLWSSYDSCDDYISKSIANGYTFSVTKTCPNELEHERTTNYQFIQVFDLDDDDIDELIAPTIQEMHEVIGGDWVKAVLFLKGSGLNASNIGSLESDYAKAIMADQRMLNDPFIQNAVYQLIRNRINQAKVGVIKVHGNYSMISGDPYLLCQSMFGLEKTGLLKAGEIYNQYWRGYDELVCFRAPMSCANNVRSVIPVDNDETNHWYQYMKTCTIFNSWDTASAALNGADYDGDLVMLTDNPVLVRKAPKLPALMCVQRKAVASIPTEADFIKSNMDSFGNDIGSTTNKITSMYAVRSNYPADSEEYRVLSYRIQCGQLFQQNAIDKAKGIVSKPMPKHWYDTHNLDGTDLRIVAAKKPYFMKYIYPDLARDHSIFVKSTDRKAMRLYGLSVLELHQLEHPTEEQQSFITYMERLNPVDCSPCVVNKICWRFEDEFDCYISKHSKPVAFDYTIMKSNTPYSVSHKREIARLYKAYLQDSVDYSIQSGQKRVSRDDAAARLISKNRQFRTECSKICPNRYALCDILLDLCYTKSSSKQFVWSMCGSDIVDNLLANNGNTILYPTLDDNGSVVYGGKRFRIDRYREEDIYDCVK